MEIRTLGAADLPACSDLAESRSWPREPPKWRLLHEVGQVFGVDAPDGGLAACAAVVPFGTVASISMVLVARRFERRGLGRAITAQALAAAGDRAVWLHASASGRPLYESMGFVADGGCRGHVGTFADDGGPGAAPGSLSSVVPLDLRAQGVGRRPLLERLGTPYVADGGFAFGVDIGHVTVIGPVVAESEDAAKAVVRGVARSVPGEVRVDPDYRFPSFTTWLRDRGLVPGVSAPRLILGGRPLPGDASLRFAPFTRALG
ncbi:Acetyltransferase (GNAT) domain-containing protein [Amycolatopsis pretoriensis]|uniref:Acetyltransferase (GNAT) domain-containing protein n=1 Tax=Amycolatopsis pretoriensis TaxID=218821 RepID=A0A1H5RD10_9PSEU|nr:GNAT family N-acetyltransferase [Amycolatopsis pretoriensis]SEF35954.1 Acetyltransferase (GNAT) domain-containing protein [Amycolatopsis pretoriensis]